MTPSPCPFPDGSGHAPLAVMVQPRRGRFAPVFQVHCICGARGPERATRDHAVEIWNAAPRGVRLVVA